MDGDQFGGEYKDDGGSFSPEEQDGEWFVVRRGMVIAGPFDSQPQAANWIADHSGLRF